MNILFLALANLNDIAEHGIYTDLMREFIRRGNKVFIASPIERRNNKPTHLLKFDGCEILKIRTENIEKTNFIKKGLATLLLEYQFKRAINKYWGDIPFDLIIYATPPITITKIVRSLKRRYGARTYLMLKDIFPQNAVDLNLIRRGGLIHRMFRRKERKLYAVSDTIGCMSPANCDYLLRHNPEIASERVEVCPNAVEPQEAFKITKEEKTALLSKYGIPEDKTLFVYGGNLGRPQGIDFLLRVVEENEKRSDSFIVIIGGGMEYDRISRWFAEVQPRNAVLLSALPKDDYKRLAACFDVGMIFLDRRFTIPNFPSRLLPYMENSLPVILATDEATDIGRIAEREGFGLWSVSGDIDKFMANMQRLVSCDRSEMGARGRDYLLKHYNVELIAPQILLSTS